jgi:hypothetical protein
MTHCALVIHQNLFIETDIRAWLSPMNKLQDNEYYEIWECPELTSNQRQIVRDAALNYFGRYYSILKITLHALDAYLGKIFNKDIFFFRKFSMNDKYVICSWIVGSAYNKIGINFTEPFQIATPDNIYDYVKSHNWTLIEKKE